MTARSSQLTSVGTRRSQHRTLRQLDKLDELLGHHVTVPQALDLLIRMLLTKKLKIKP